MKREEIEYEFWRSCSYKGVNNLFNLIISKFVKLLSAETYPFVSHTVLRNVSTNVNHPSLIL